MRCKPGALKSRGEEKTTGILRKYFGGRPYIIFKDVALNQVVELDRSELPPREFDYFTRASLDFVICQDDGSLTYELAIEYDGQKHEAASQAWRDRIKDRICRESDLPLIRIGSVAVQMRRNTTILEFILDQYFGEKAISELRASGRLSSEEEYFIQFPATIAIQKRLMQSGLFPAMFALNPTFDLFWHQVLEQGTRHAEHLSAAYGFWEATTEVNVFQGSGCARKVLSMTRTVSIQDPNPGYSVLGVHGWHIACELATYLCFDSIDREWLAARPSFQASR
jgi:hypothetical protein